MTTRQGTEVGELRIGADEVNTRLKSGVSITFLDVRNDKAWEAIPLKISGAIRIRPAEWHMAPSWPKDRLTVAY